MKNEIKIGSNVEISSSSLLLMPWVNYDTGRVVKIDKHGDVLVEWKNSKCEAWIAISDLVLL